MTFSNNLTFYFPFFFLGGEFHGPKLQQHLTEYNLICFSLSKIAGIFFLLLFWVTYFWCSKKQELCQCSVNISLGSKAFSSTIIIIVIFFSSFYPRAICKLLRKTISYPRRQYREKQFRQKQNLGDKSWKREKNLRPW